MVPGGAVEIDEHVAAEHDVVDATVGQQRLVEKIAVVEAHRLADRFAQALVGREIKKLPTLRGRTVITMFYENSTRTRVSFEVAGKWMSADVINVSAAGSSVGKGESLRDTALTFVPTR